MTERQRRFCDEYLISLNATSAAIKAGYSEKHAHTNASKLLQNTTVKEYIEKRMAEKEEALVAKQDEIMKYLTAVMRRELSEHVVVTTSEKKSYYAPDADGKMRKHTEETETPQVVEIPARISDANKAAELLGRAYAMFSEKVEIDGAVPVIVDDSGEE